MKSFFRKAIGCLGMLFLLIPSVISCGSSGFASINLSHSIEGIIDIKADKYIETEESITYGCQKGEDLTIFLVLELHYYIDSSNFRVEINDKTVDYTTETIDEHTNVECKINNVQSDLDVKVFGELNKDKFDVRVIPYIDGSDSDAKKITALKQANGPLPFCYAYKIIKNGKLLKDTLLDNEWVYYDAFYDAVSSYNRDYSYNDLIEFYIKSGDIHDSGLYTYNVSDFAQIRKTTSKCWQMDTRFDSTTNILTYSLTVKETVAIEMFKFSKDEKINNHFSFDNSEYVLTKTDPNSYYFDEMKVLDSNLEEITTLSSLVNTTSRTLNIKIKDGTAIKLANALTSNLKINGESIPSSSFSLLDNLLTISNVKLPYEYIGDETYSLSCQRGRSYIISFKDAEEYMLFNKDSYSHVDYANNLSDQKYISRGSVDNIMVNNGILYFDGDYYWRNDCEATLQLHPAYIEDIPVVLYNLDITFVCPNDVTYNIKMSNPMKEEYATQSGIKVSISNDSNIRNKYYIMVLPVGFPSIEDIQISLLQS